MYDYIIVGAGSAGCVLANRLTEGDARVLVLEAGPEDKKPEIRIPLAFTKLFKTKYDWNYTTEPQPALRNRRLYWPRGKVLGGSSSLNAQMHIRGNPADFDQWAALGNNGWGYRDVLPYFRRSEHNERGSADHRGTGGPLHIAALRALNPATRAFVRAAIETGLPRCEDVNGPRQDGVDFTQVTQRRGARCSAADAYLKPAHHRENLHIVTEAHAARLLFEGRRAVGIEYIVGGRREVARATREVIVSGGAVNSPQLLMLSGIGPAAHLHAVGIEAIHNLPGVGQNLQDHLAFAVVVTARQPVSLVTAETPLNVLRFLLFRRGVLTSNAGEACAFVRSGPGLAAPDIELLFAPAPFIDHGLVKPTSHGLTIVVVLLQPRSIGTLRLRSSDPFASPHIDPGYLSDPEGYDLQQLVTGIMMARRILDAPALEPFVGAMWEPGAHVRTDEQLEAFIREQAESLYHPVGTCKMGVDEMAVVDSQLRVHGIEGLRVVDASVMPTIVRGHTNAATIMIAEKAVDLILGAA